LDNIRCDKKCKLIDANSKIDHDEKIDENLCYIVKGKLTVEQEAIIPELFIDFNKKIQSDEKILFFQTKFDKFSIREEEETNTIIENGIEKEETMTVIKKEWSKYFSGQDKLESKVISGRVN
jgi:hypothetical protein